MIVELNEGAVRAAVAAWFEADADDYFDNTTPGIYKPDGTHPQLDYAVGLGGEPRVRVVLSSDLIGILKDWAEWPKALDLPAGIISDAGIRLTFDRPSGAYRAALDVGPYTTESPPWGGGKGLGEGVVINLTNDEVLAALARWVNGPDDDDASLPDGIEAYDWEPQDFVVRAEGGALKVYARLEHDLRWQLAMWACWKGGLNLTDAAGNPRVLPRDVTVTGPGIDGKVVVRIAVRAEGVTPEEAEAMDAAATKETVQGHGGRAGEPPTDAQSANKGWFGSGERRPHTTTLVGDAG